MPISAKRMVAGARSNFRFSRRHLLKNEDMVICKGSAGNFLKSGLLLT
jgi:hypothetical protein